jgi:Lon protease-like protein
MVLFPQAVLSLRIFEPRYLAMVGDCLKSGKPFGVTLIREGRDTGKAASFHPLGTLARIIDFDRLEDGLLGLSCLGQERFRVLSHQVRKDQLIMAQIERFPEEPIDQVNESLLTRYQQVSDFLLETLEKQELQRYRQTIVENWRDSSWIGYQLAQLLPLNPEDRQALLGMTRTERLSELSQLLQKNNML